MSGYPNNNQSSGQRPPTQAKFAPRQSSLFRVPPDVVSDYRQKTKSLYQNEQNDSSSSVNYQQQNQPYNNGQQFKQQPAQQNQQLEHQKRPQYTGPPQQQYNAPPQGLPQSNGPSQVKQPQRPSLDPGYSITSAEIPIKASPIVLDYQQKGVDSGRKNSSAQSPTIDSAGQLSMRSVSESKQSQSSNEKINGTLQDEKLPRNGSKVSNGSDQMLDDKEKGRNATAVMKGLENKTKPELLVITKKMLAEINIKNRIISEANHNTNWLTAELSAMKDGKISSQDPVNDFQKSVANSSALEQDKLMLESLLKLKSQLDEAKSDIEKHEASLLVLEKKRTVAEEEAAYLRTLTDRNADVGSLESERINELEAQLKNTVEDYTVLQSKVSQWARASKRNQEGRIAAEAAQKTLEEDIRALKSELRKKGSGDKNLEKQMVVLEQTLGDTRNQLQVMEDNLNDAYTTIDQLETESIAMQEKITAEYARLDELNETADSYRMRCEELEGELAAQNEYAEIIKKRASNASTILDGPTRSEIDELMEKNAFLEEQLKRVAMEHEDVQETHRKLQISNQELQYNYEMASKKNEKLAHKLGPEAVAQEEEYMKRVTELEAANNFAIERQQQAEVDIINLKKALALTKSQTPSFQDLKETLQDEKNANSALKENLDKALVANAELVKKLENMGPINGSRNIGNADNSREITTNGAANGTHSNMDDEKAELENQIGLLNISLQEEKQYAAEIASQLQALQGEKEEALAQIDDLNHILAEERNTSETLYQQIQDIEAEQDGLMNKLDSVVVQLKQERAVNENHLSTINSLQQTSDSSGLDRQLIDLKENLAQEQEASYELNEKLQILGNEKTLLMNKVQELNETIKTVSGSNNPDYEKELQDLNETLAAERDAYDELTEKMQILADEKSQLLNQVQQHLESSGNNSNDESEKQIQELTETLHAERDAYDELAEKMQILSEEKNRVLDQVQEYEKQVQELNETLLAERDAYDELADKVHVISEEKISLQSQIVQLTEKLQSLGDNPRENQAEVHRDLAVETDAAATLALQLEALGNEKTQLVVQLEQLQKRIHTLEESSNPELAAKLAELTETLNVERDAYDELNEKLQILSDEKEKLLNQVQSLEQELQSTGRTDHFEGEQEIADLRETLNAERDAYDELNEKMTALDAERRTHNERSLSHTTEKDDLLSQIQILKEQLASAANDNPDTGKVIEDLNNNLMAERDAYDELSERMLAISDEKAGLLVEIQQLKERVESLSNDTASGEQLKDLNETLAAERDAYDELAEKMNALGQEKSNLEAKLNEMAEIANKSDSQKKEIEQELLDLKKKIDLQKEKQTSVEDLSISLQEEKMAFEDLTNKMQKLSSEKAELLNQVEEKNDLLQEEQDAYTSLAQKMQSIQIEKSELYQQVEELEVRLSTVGANTNGIDYPAQIGKLQQQLSETQDNIEMLQIQLEERTQDVEMLEQRLAKAGNSDDVGKLNAELSSAKSKLENQSTVIQEQLATIAKLDEQLGSEEDKIHTLETELSNLYEKVIMMNNLESEIEEKDHEIQRNKHIMNELKTQLLDLEDTKMQIERLQSELDTKTKDIEKLQEIIDGLEKANADSISQKQILEQQVEKLSKSLNQE
ncbi:hypothetical protein HDV01_003741 [Terramyces sp. JEL0728]|nr:hypothetical protein HDV01_003741 [Terramyces sp. JEL0728]